MMRRWHRQARRDCFHFLTASWRRGGNLGMRGFSFFQTCLRSSLELWRDEAFRVPDGMAVAIGGGVRAEAGIAVDESPFPGQRLIIPESATDHFRDFRKGDLVDVPAVVRP